MSEWNYWLMLAAGVIGLWIAGSSIPWSNFFDFKLTPPTIGGDKKIKDDNEHRSAFVAAVRSCESLGITTDVRPAFETWRLAVARVEMPIGNEVQNES